MPADLAALRECITASALDALATFLAEHRCPRSAAMVRLDARADVGVGDAVRAELAANAGLRYYDQSLALEIVAAWEAGHDAIVAAGFAAWETTGCPVCALAVMHQDDVHGRCGGCALALERVAS